MGGYDANETLCAYLRMSKADDVRIPMDDALLTGWGSDAHGVLIERMSENRCSSYFIKEPVPSSDVPQSTRDAIGTANGFFFLQSRSAPGTYLAATFQQNPGAASTDVTTAFTVAAATQNKDDAMLFFQKSYGIEQGLPVDTLLGFFRTSQVGMGPDGDPNVKAFCITTTGPFRVYETPIRCGNSYSLTDCPLDWQACNYTTGYCFDSS